jgi:DNA-nicking Smr family endonuclease
MSRRRHLRPEEEELWQTVTRSVTPRLGSLHPKLTLKAAEPPAMPVVRDDALGPAAPPLSPFRLGERVAKPRITADLTKPLTEAPLQMDAKAFGKMTRGKLAPDARIDLHGLTLAEAHPELVRFLLNAHASGARLVLVITGKGSRAVSDHGPIPQRQGVLRHQVPLWLRQAPLGPVVLQVAEAHLKHGGSGACYVYLRRG